MEQRGGNCQDCCCRGGSAFRGPGNDLITENRHAGGKKRREKEEKARAQKKKENSSLWRCVFGPRFQRWVTLSRPGPSRLFLGETDNKQRK
ncbi:hypothetical protein FQA47_007075 [Oryzias melastigma]|uniref:Uncharacterized protein n=1 Tax=Oryzias melastigma TaxID=30732 RepID=A0A834EYE7_ORYME|nr:hypothetical protein FQA47_007075 [Oryzias melastigma]